MRARRKIVIIAGPNAAGLSPFQPDAAAFRASRPMLEEIVVQAAAGRNFACETTLSGRTYAAMIPAWRSAGYQVMLLFLGLESAGEAIARVAMRMRQSGHAIPPPVIRCRSILGWRNFKEAYRPSVDYWQWHDNGDPTPRLLEEGANS